MKWVNDDEYGGEDTEIVTETSCVCGANLHYWIYEENGHWIHEYFCPNNCGKFKNQKVICGKVIFKSLQRRLGGE